MTNGVLGSMLSTGFQNLIGYKVGTVPAKNETEIRPKNSFYSGLTTGGASKKNQKFGLNHQQDGNCEVQIREGGFEWRRKGIAWKGP